MAVERKFHFSRAHFSRVKRWDRVARWVISLGGGLVILAVLAILIMIAKVALPLFFPARIAPLHELALRAPAGDTSVVAVGADEYLESAFVLDADGNCRFLNLADGVAMTVVPLDPPASDDAASRPRIVDAEEHGDHRYSLTWSDGSLSLMHVRFLLRFDETGLRRIDHEVEQPAAQPKPDGAPTPVLARARHSAGGGDTFLRLMPDDTLAIVRQTKETDFLGNDTTAEASFVLRPDWPGRPTALVLSTDGAILYAGTDTGWLLRWDLARGENDRLLDRFQAFEDGRAITTLGMALGDISLAVGDAAGGLSTWFAVPSGSDAGGAAPLTRIHTLARHAAPVRRILHSLRNKSLLSLNEAGDVHLDHMTSERHLLSLNPPRPLRLAALNARGDGVIGIDEAGGLRAWTIENPHPEISWSTLFGKVHYEGYRRPEYVWQSSAATNDVEPKFSLVPLIFGTLKGTLYAMIFAVPLAILGALYTSQFMDPNWRRWVKPAVEIMAAIPSVVVGFLGGLWLAPLMERSILGVFLWLILLPAVMAATLILWERLERTRTFRRVGRGNEFLFVIPMIFLATMLAFAVGPWLESGWFGGSFGQWLFDQWEVRYDQRNCIVIAFALGFAVVPIIFTISEDSLSNIPGSMTAASLALGASRWQTAWRIVLPSASPGIFAAVMIGFGRAVGETMIVLMATGNTPIMDWSPFNGMRTLSANIAVEIPEAPVDGTLYRILFLTAVLLFIMTFCVNTLAEIVRQRLRRKYGQIQ
jgi:phosphate transport system permease protein